MNRVLLAQLIPEVMALDAARQELDDATVELVKYIDGAPAKRAAARHRFRCAFRAMDLAETRLHFSKCRLAGVPHLRVL